MRELQERIEFFRNMFTGNTNIYCWEYNTGKELLYSNCEDEQILMNYLFLDMPEDQWIQKACGTKPFTFTNTLDMTWGFIPYKTLDSVSIYAIGPVFFRDINIQVFRANMNVLDMTVSSQIKISKILSSIPIMQSVHFNKMLGMLYYALFESEMDQYSVDDILANSKESTPELLEFNPHGLYVFEQLLVENMEKGDLYFDQFYYTLSQRGNPTYRFGVMCPGDPLRQSKDEGITTTAVLLRAAIRAGVDPDEAYSMGDYYIQQLEECHNSPDVLPVLKAMHDHFIDRVRQCKFQHNLSSDIQKCQSYIQVHLSESIDLKKMASDLGFNPYYLSRKFKAETNRSINDYITDKKIERSKFLLSSSKMSVLEISEKLGFSSPSYFSTNFKNRCGVTPKQYRSQL